MSTTVTKTIDNCIAEVRQVLNDMQAPYRYSDAWMISILNTALREVYRLRPDAYIGNFTTGVLSANLAPTYSTSDLQVINGVANPTPPTPATPFPIDDRLFFGPVTFYVAGRIEINDDQFADNNRAMTLMQAFRAELVGVGG